MQDVVPVLGKRSGYEEGYSKRDECQKLGHGWISGGKQYFTIDCDIPNLANRYVVVPNDLPCMKYRNDIYGLTNDSRSLMHSIDINHFREFPSMDLLPKCAVYIQLKLLSVIEAGDHDVALCEVVGTGVWDETEQGIVSKEVSPAALDPTTALYTAQLRAEGII